MAMVLRKVVAHRNSYLKFISIWVVAKRLVVSKISQDDDIEYEFLKDAVGLWAGEG